MSLRESHEPNLVAVIRARNDGPMDELAPGHATTTPRQHGNLIAVQAIPAGRPSNGSPEGDIVQAMLPFAFLAALLVVVALGALRIHRAIKNLASEAIVRRLREERARRQPREQAKYEKERAQCELRSACWSFRHATTAHKQHREAPRRSVGECMALIPDLVHDRLLEPENARVLECNVRLLTVAGGELRTVEEERERAKYLDSVT